MTRSKFYLILFILVGGFFLSNCKKDDDRPREPILFSIEDDKKLGLQLKQEIANNPQEYPLLDRTQYATAYSILDTIISKVLNSGKVKYKDEFAWEFYIIHNDSVLNAFCAPGGYIYVYTGLIKYLDSEDDLAGVLGHEIAHADLRHSTRQMEKVYGAQMLSSILLGDSSIIAKVALQLAALKFSREMESEADEFSVIYLCPTDYPADGAANFFDKLINSGQSGWVPEFLSTHPSPDNRIDNIRNKKNELGCSGANEYISRYQRLKNALP